MIKLVINGIYILSLISVILFAILFIKIIYDHSQANKKVELTTQIKEEVSNYLAGAEIDLEDEFSRFKLKILENIIIDYLQQVRGTTADKLKKLAENSGVVDLKVEQLIDSDQWWKKSEAAYALGNLRSKRAIKPLLECLEEQNSDLRYQSALALAKIDGTKYLDEAINRLLELKFYPNDVILRLIEAVEEDIYPVMEQLLSSQEIKKKIIALRSLGLKQDYRALKWIKDYLQAENSKLVIACLKAAYHLGDVDDDQYFKLLLSTRNKDDTKVRANLAKVLEKFRSSASRRELKELMTDPQWEVRYNAAQSLLAHGNKGLLALSQQLGSEDNFAQDIAWQTLQQEMLFNDLLADQESVNQQQLVENIRNYLSTTAEEGDNLELGRYFN